MSSAALTADGAYCRVRRSIHGLSRCRDAGHVHEVLDTTSPTSRCPKSLAVFPAGTDESTGYDFVLLSQTPSFSP